MVKDISKRTAGLPTKEQILMSHQNTDRIPAQIKPIGGGLPQPAKLTQGEFVWSIPAIIGLGEGDYAKGAKMLEHIHKELKAYGENIMGTKQGHKKV